MQLRAFHTIEDAVSCRACGATHASPHPNQWGLCGECFTKFKYRSGGGELTDEAVTEQLARELVLTMKRLNQKGQIGRCEAISGWFYKDVPRGAYQCAHKAISTYNGRRVCALHAKAIHLRFCGEKASDPYETFTNIARDLAEKDELFRQAIMEVLA